jgi:hypothetical protein
LLSAWDVASRTALAQALPRTLTGVVRDSAGRPLENAVIALNPNSDTRVARADAQGRFRFDRVDAGQYALRVTWLGYEPVDTTILVPREGLSITIVLKRLPFQLDTLAVIARRKGIIGTTVRKRDHSALGGVDVQVLGRPLRTKTQADGRFTFDVREGSYVVIGKRDGYETTVLLVPVPADEAVELAMAMDSATTKRQLIANNRFQDLQMRWHRASAMNTAMVTRHELVAVGNVSLDVALRYSPSFLYKALVWDMVECVYIDGMPKPSLRAKDIAAEEVAMVEVYAGGGGMTREDREFFARNGTICGVGPSVETFETGRGALRAFRPPKPGTVSVVYVWLKN